MAVKKLCLITFIPALGDFCNKQQKHDTQRLKLAHFFYFAKEITALNASQQTPLL
jgi:hypothetical protein